MARDRHSAGARKHLPFKDRETVLADFSSHVEALRGRDKYFVVLTAIGVGGAGKTRLIDQLISQSRTQGFKPVRISLETEMSNTFLEPLTKLREELNFDCLLFDVALLRYWQASGQPQQIRENQKLSGSFVLRALQTGLSLGQMALPLSFGVEVFERAAGAVTRYRRYDKAEFEEIDALGSDSAALLDRLAWYLGSDVERRLVGAKERYVFFYDSYEKQSAKTIADQSHWLRDFIGKVDRGIHFIAGRERIVWPQEDWGQIMAQPYFLDTLPEPDVRALIEEQCQADEAITSYLVELSRCIPFHVEMAINTYLELAAGGGPVRIEDLPRDHETAINRFIGHLPDSHQPLVIALAGIQFFDAALVQGIVRSLNLATDHDTAEELMDSFFVEVVDQSVGLFKVHDLLTEHVRASQRYAKRCRTALNAAASHLKVRAAADGSASDWLPIFASLCVASAQLGHNDRAFCEALIEAGYAQYDQGHWRALAELQSPADRQSSSGDLVVAYFHAICRRRLQSVPEGLRALRQLEPRKAEFGLHSMSLDIELAYLTELTGDYATAREAFTRIDNAQRPFNPFIRPHLRARLYLADMLAMDGDFEQSERLLVDASKTMQGGSPGDWAELMRHRGHALRFSLLLEEAESCYLRALEVSQGFPSMVAKLQTNLAETRCWSEPDRAIVNADDAIEQNEQLGNRLEVSKARTARAIALARLGELDLALEDQKQAEALSRQTGYPAGVAFALIARALIEHQRGHASIVHAKRNEVVKLVNEIGTYPHLPIIPVALDEGLSDAGRIADEVGWIEPEAYRDRLSGLLAAVLPATSSSD